MVSKPQKQPNDKSPDAQRLIGKMSEEEIDYNVMGSFPASDPPSWTLGISRRKKSTDEFEGEKSRRTNLLTKTNSSDSDGRGKF